MWEGDMTRSREKRKKVQVFTCPYLNDHKQRNEEAIPQFTGNLLGGADGKAWYVGGLTTDVQKETVSVCKL